MLLDQANIEPVIIEHGNYEYLFDWLWALCAFYFFFLGEHFSHRLDRWGIIEVISQLLPNKWIQQVAWVACVENVSTQTVIILFGGFEIF